MAINHPKAGANSVPAYQLSGVPFVTSSAGGEVQASPIEVTFPYVTRFFVVQNTSANPMRIGFTADGVNADITANYLVLSGNDKTPRMELRCKSLFFRKDSTGNCSFKLKNVLLSFKKKDIGSAVHKSDNLRIKVFSNCREICLVQVCLC